MRTMHSIADARRNLPKLIREAERGETVRLTRRGEPVAVLMGLEAFARMAAGRRDFAEAWDEFTNAVELHELAIEPAELLEGARDTEPGRDPNF